MKKFELRSEGTFWIYMIMNILSILLLSFFIMKHIDKKKLEKDIQVIEMNEGLRK